MIKSKELGAIQEGKITAVDLLKNHNAIELIDDLCALLQNKKEFEDLVITNQKMNNYLKELQTLCDIHKTLHCHLFRKTYGTLLLNKGIRLETVSKCLGHANTKITQQAYAKLLSQTVIDEVKKII